MKLLANHIFHYLPLIAILTIGLVGLIVFSYDRAFQFVIMTALSTAYITWGIIHHYIHDDLHFSIVLEYLTIAVLGMIIVFSVLFRA
jgi:hypothetical protein